MSNELTNPYPQALSEAQDLFGQITWTSQQDFDTVCDAYARKLIEKVGAAYSEGFQSGTLSNGGLNVPLKQVYTICKHLEMPVKQMPEIESYASFSKLIAELDESVVQIEAALEQKHFPKLLGDLAKAQHSLFQIACLSGLADTFTEAFNEISRYTIENLEYQELQEAIKLGEIEAKDSPLPDEPMKPDFAQILIRKQELVRKANDLMAARKAEEDKDKPKSSIIL